MLAQVTKVAVATLALVVGAAAPVAVPLGVRIPVATTAEYDTDATAVGDTFSFATTDASRLGDLTVPAGTPGTGTVVSVVAGQGFRGGRISFVPQRLRLADGREIAIRADSKNGHFDEKVRAHFFPGVMTTTQNLTVKSGVRFVVVTAAQSPPIPPDSHATR